MGFEISASLGYLYNTENKEFGHYEMSMISSDDVMNYQVTVTEGHKSSTKKLKYSFRKNFLQFHQKFS